MRKVASGLTCCAAAGAMVLGAATVDAAVVRAAGYDRGALRLANSKPRYESVGQISVYSDRGAMIKQGSGVLINRRWVLTAAHVLEGGEAEGTRATTVVFEQGEFNTPIPQPQQHGFHPLGPLVLDRYVGREMHFGQNWYTPKQFQGTKYLLSGFDIALVDLGPNAITGPAQFPRLPPANSRLGTGKEVTIVGHGNPGVGSAGIGAAGAQLEFVNESWGNYRRAGTNILDGRLNNTIPIYPNPETGPGEPLYLNVNSHISAFDFDNANFGGADPYFDDGRFDLNDYPTAREINTSSGDSGGGLFWGQWLVGLVSGGYDPNAGFNDLSFNTDVSVFTNWIRRVMAAVQRNDRTQPWLYRQNNGFNPMFFEEGTPFSTQYARSGVIPEPTSAMLVLAAAGGLVMSRRRD